MNRLASITRKEQEFWQDVAQGREERERQSLADLHERIAWVRSNYTVGRAANNEINRLTLKRDEFLKKANELSEDDRLFLNWVETRKAEFKYL